MATIKINNVTAITESSGTVSVDASVVKLVPTATASAPGSPTEGMLYYNSTIECLMVYRSGWKPLALITDPTWGGIKTTYSSYTVHTFLHSDVFVTTVAKTVDILVVAGGGGGGSADGAGGGAGGVIYKTSYSIPIGKYEINVGLGGNGDTTAQHSGMNGGDSSFAGLLVADGGGGGGTESGASYMQTSVGGSGGGAGGGGGSGTGAVATGASGGGDNGVSSDPQGWGNAGGNTSGTSAGYGGGGGGGSSSAGTAQGTSGIGGNGGNGLRYSIRTGELDHYATGGGGASRTSNAYGYGGSNNIHKNHGGSGYNPGQPTHAEGNSARDNTGSGGGGGSESARPGGSGGSGIVVIRYTT